MVAEGAVVTLQLTRVDNTDYTYDVEERGEDGWIWIARVIYMRWAEMRIARGYFSPAAGEAIRGRLKEPHGRVCTVQVGGR